ncbi:hypothetical protein MKX01_031806 [Papaver californicum]|nr:hypothetical protein MKX01_031806 [Papaver californicum]
MKKPSLIRLSSSSINDGWFNETKRFFLSGSFSSSSSESQRRKKTHLRRKRGLGIGESFAVFKHSSDPHSDFRTSMVETIIQKQIFSAKDLEKLL